HERAGSRTARVIFYRPARPGGLRILPHGTEFDHLERPPIQPHTFLRVKDRTGRLEPDEERGQQHERREENQTQRGDDDIHSALQAKLPAAQRDIAHRQKRRAAQIVDVQIAGHIGEHVRIDFDVYPAPLAQIHQFDQLGARRVLNGDDHLLDLIGVDQIWQLMIGAQDRNAEHIAFFVVLAIDDADDVVTEHRAALDFSGDFAGNLSRAENQQVDALVSMLAQQTHDRLVRFAAQNGENRAEQPDIEEHRARVIDVELRVVKDQPDRTISQNRANRDCAEDIARQVDTADSASEMVKTRHIEDRDDGHDVQDHRRQVQVDADFGDLL